MDALPHKYSDLVDDFFISFKSVSESEQNKFTRKQQHYRPTCFACVNLIWSRMYLSDT